MLCRWVEAFGGIANGLGPEISPKKSYFGEGLDYAVAGRTFNSPYDSILQASAASPYALCGC